jgi:hypothetical protein
MIFTKAISCVTVPLQPEGLPADPDGYFAQYFAAAVFVSATTGYGAAMGVSGAV